MGHLYAGRHFGWAAASEAPLAAIFGLTVPPSLLALADEVTE
jgi:hypothetical protein